MKKSRLVSIEKLEESQPTRPRHWIPVYCVIFFLLLAPVFTVYLLASFEFGDITKSVYDMLPNIEFTFNGITFGKSFAWLTLILPCALLFLNIFSVSIAIRMAVFRHAYWWYAIWVLLAFIGMLLLVAFWELLNLVPGFSEAVRRMIPADVIDILGSVFVYGNVGYTAALLVSLVFGFFYCVNYPAKYERIYQLRKRHLKALRTPQEKKEYRKRFYHDYKRGKWISMMLDLHAESLKAGSRERMDKDAYDFLVYYSCLCDATVKKAVFDEYARNGRYYECRNLFHEIQAKSEAVEGGAKIRLPVYVPPAEPTIKRRPKAPAPAPAPKRKHYRPDEI